MYASLIDCQQRCAATDQRFLSTNCLVLEVANVVLGMVLAIDGKHSDTLSTRNVQIVENALGLNLRTQAVGVVALARIGTLCAKLHTIAGPVHRKIKRRE